jgi:hypothetical protein
VLNGVPDPELRDAARMTKALFDAVERVANVAKRVMEVAEKARRNERLRGDIRIEWFKSIVDGTTAVAKFLQSDLAPTFVAMGALGNVFLIRNNSNTLADVIGTTELVFKKNRHRGQTWIYGGSIIGADSDKDGNVSTWSYPRGGKPNQTIEKIPDIELMGVTVSHKQSR